MFALYPPFRGDHEPTIARQRSFHNFHAVPLHGLDLSGCKPAIAVVHWYPLPRFPLLGVVDDSSISISTVARKHASVLELRVTFNTKRAPTKRAGARKRHRIDSDLQQ